MALSATTKANTHVAFICLHHLLRGSISWSYLGLRKESEPGNRTNKDARLTWRSSSRSKPIQGHFQESRLSSHNTAPPPWTAHFTWLLFHHPISKEVIPRPWPTLFFPHSFQFLVPAMALGRWHSLLSLGNSYSSSHLGSHSTWVLCWHLHPNPSPPTWAPYFWHRGENWHSVNFQHLPSTMLGPFVFLSAKRCKMPLSPSNFSPVLLYSLSWDPT